MAYGVHGDFRALVAAGPLEGTLPVGPSVAPTDTVGACHLRIATTAAPGSGGLALPGIVMVAIAKVPVRSTVEGVATGAAAMATVVATAALGIVTAVVALAASGVAAEAAEEAAVEAAAEMAATTVASAASAIGTGTATMVAMGRSGVPAVETMAAESMTVTRSVGDMRTVAIGADGILHPLPQQALLRRIQTQTVSGVCVSGCDESRNAGGGKATATSAENDGTTAWLQTQSIVAIHSGIGHDPQPRRPAPLP
jgi:hypothetical protein